MNLEQETRRVVELKNQFRNHKMLPHEILVILDKWYRTDTYTYPVTVEWEADREVWQLVLVHPQIKPIVEYCESITNLIFSTLCTLERKLNELSA